MQTSAFWSLPNHISCGNIKQLSAPLGEGWLKAFTFSVQQVTHDEYKEMNVRVE